jgi:hypothetical protein
LDAENPKETEAIVFGLVRQRPPEECCAVAVDFFVAILAATGGTD